MISFNEISNRSVFSKRELLDLKAKEHILIEGAKKGDIAPLFKFWAEKKDMFVARSRCV